MERIRHDDESALASLFRVTYARLCRHARMYVQSAAAAEDVVDDVFLTLWAQRAELRVHGSVTNYLHTAVRNRALNRLKRQRLEERYVAGWTAESDGGSAFSGTDIEDRLHAEELTTLLRQAIATLPPRTRQAYTLYCQHEMRYAEIARVMGISVRTVEHQIARAVQILWQRLEGRVR
jgi:RNA polymerase sigma-70 factor (ECF subfamily)